MGKIRRLEYVGGTLGLIYIVLCVLTVILIPVGLVFLLENMILIEEEIDNPNDFMEHFRKGKVGR